MALEKMKVGAAKYCISPTEDMMPMRQDFSGSVFDAVRENEDIYVRAIAVSNGEKIFLFEGFELGTVPCPDILREKLQSRFGLLQENMLLTANHNHSAPHPAGMSRPGDTETPEVDENTRKFTDRCLEQALHAAEDALNHMRPAKYGYGEGKSYININRDQHFDDGYWMQGENWEGCSDKTLAVIKFVDEEGKLIGAILNYAMHSTTSFAALDVDGKIKITCDAPGIACNYVERYYGNDAVVMWQSGAAGNQNPYFVNVRQNFDKDGTMFYTNRIPGAAYEQGDVMGQQHGRDAVRALANTEAVMDKVKITTVDKLLYFPTQKFPEGIDWAFHRLMVDNLLHVGFAGGVDKDKPLPEKKLAEMIPCDEKAPMKAQLILFGDVTIYGMACELYNEIAMLCKENSPYKHLMIATHIGNPQVGYILDDNSKGHKVFQSFGLVREGESNGIVVNGMLDMFKEALQR